MTQVLILTFQALLQIGLFVLISPAVTGIHKWTKARLQLRKGPPFQQQYFNLIKLMNIRIKQRPETTSWVYTIAPFSAFACYALLSWATPPFGMRFVPLDFVTIVFLLALARFLMALAAMDTGTAFGGMGSSREMFINVIAEPVLIFIILALTFQHHTTDLGSIITGLSNMSSLGSAVFNVAALLFLWLALALVALMDNGLLPIDNPSTHLELTMIQKALHLEYTGRNLALIEWGEAMRFTFFLSLLGDLLFPRYTFLLPGIPSYVISAILYVVKLLIGVGLISLFEITQIRLPLRRLVIPWVAALLLAISAAFMALAAAFIVVGP